MHEAYSGFNGRAWRLGSEPDHIGRGAPFCPEGKPLKTSRLSHWQVLTPRLLGLIPRAGRKKPIPVSNPPMTLARPMFPPRADSVHAFPAQPAIGQPESQAPTTESTKPSGGPSRRHLLAGLAILPASVVGIRLAKFTTPF